MLLAFLRPKASYLRRLIERMERVGFAPDHEVLLLARRRLPMRLAPRAPWALDLFANRLEASPSNAELAAICLERVK